MNENTRKCPKCQRSDKIDRNLKCHFCGSQLEFDPRENAYNIKLVDCPACGYSNNGGANYCVKCRKKLSDGAEVKGAKRKIQEVLIALLAVIVILVSSQKIYTSFFASPAEPPVTPVVVNLPVSEPTPFVKPDKVRMDVVFCVDTTGSMGDEIAVIKGELLKMVEEIRQGNPQPEVRFGVVAYRDRGDEYITKKYPLIYDIKETQEVINSLSAAGGGDYPESVGAGLHTAVQEMNWDKDDNVRKIMFLIGDASPHEEYEQGYSYAEEMKAAGKMGIMINTISCSGMEEYGNSVFQEVAAMTNGSFEYLTYRYAYEDGEGNKHVVLNQAGKDYVVEEDYVDCDDWREGASEMAVSDKAKECTSSFCGDSEESGFFTGGTDCASPPSGSYTNTETVNNLDSIMTKSLKREAEKSGVTY